MKGRARLNVAFDLDGTLTDPFVGISRSVQKGLAAVGVVVEDPATLGFFIGPPLHRTLREVYGLDGNQVGMAVAAYREYYEDRGMYENVVYEGIPEVLARLRDDGCRVYLATSKPLYYARKILDHFGLSQFFDGLAASELDGTRSDKTEVLSWLLSTQGLEAADTIMVGDRSFDMEAARTLACAGLGVGYGYGSAEELRQAGAQWYAPDVASLEVILGRELRARSA